MDRDANLAASVAGRGMRAAMTHYYSLTKPGVLYVNVATVMAGVARTNDSCRPGLARRFTAEDAMRRE